MPKRLPRTLPTEELIRKVARKESRKLKARREKRAACGSAWGCSGVVGWSVAIPHPGGDRLGGVGGYPWPGPYSWTLMLLVIGVGLGCLNAWYWIKRESRHD